MDEERVSFPVGRPHQWTRLQASPGWPRADLSSLHYIPYDDILSSHPTVRTDWRLPASFGTTETLTIVTTATTGDAMPGSYGRPLPGNTIKILDGQTGDAVPRGERGEIAIKGPTLMLGYLGKAADETFDDEGFYRTGDGGFMDEGGRLFWEGRLTDMIKTGGANVSPQEVDAVLANCPGVRRAQTVGVPHAMLGEEVVACVVRHEEAALDEDAVRAFARARLASFKVPRTILFFDMGDLAVTGSEKVKTGALRALAAARLNQNRVSGRD